MSYLENKPSHPPVIIRLKPLKNNPTQFTFQLLSNWVFFFLSTEGVLSMFSFFLFFFFLLMFHCRACGIGGGPSLVLTYYNIFFSSLLNAFCDFCSTFFPFLFFLKWKIK